MARQSAPMSLALCLAFLTLAASKTAPGTVRLTDSGGVEIPHSSCGTTGGYLQVFDGVRWGFVGSSGFGSDVYSKNSVCKQVLCNFGSNAVQVVSVVRPSGSYVAWSDVRCGGELYAGGLPGLGGCSRRQAGVTDGGGLSDGSVVHMVCSGVGGVRRGARRLNGSDPGSTIGTVAGVIGGIFFLTCCTFSICFFKRVVLNASNSGIPTTVTTQQTDAVAAAQARAMALTHALRGTAGSPTHAAHVSPHQGVGVQPPGTTGHHGHNQSALGAGFGAGKEQAPPSANAPYGNGPYPSAPQGGQFGGTPYPSSQPGGQAVTSPYPTAPQAAGPGYPPSSPLPGAPAMAGTSAYPGSSAYSGPAAYPGAVPYSGTSAYPGQPPQTASGSAPPLQYPSYSQPPPPSGYC